VIINVCGCNIAGSDAGQRKRERDKARWLVMSQEKKDEINKKHREAYKRRKEQHLHIETSIGNIAHTLVNKNIHITINVSYM
jgi:hypothetical protein